MIQCALIEKYDEITQILHFIIDNKQGNFALIFVYVLTHIYIYMRFEHTVKTMFS